MQDSPRENIEYIFYLHKCGLLPKLMWYYIQNTMLRWCWWIHEYINWSKVLFVLNRGGSKCHVNLIDLFLMLQEKEKPHLQIGFCSVVARLWVCRSDFPSPALDVPEFFHQAGRTAGNWMQIQAWKRPIIWNQTMGLLRSANMKQKWLSGICSRNFITSIWICLCLYTKQINLRVNTILGSEKNVLPFQYVPWMVRSFWEDLLWVSFHAEIQDQIVEDQAFSDVLQLQLCNTLPSLILFFLEESFLFMPFYMFSCLAIWTIPWSFCGAFQLLFIPALLFLLLRNSTTGLCTSSSALSKSDFHWRF